MSLNLHGGNQITGLAYGGDGQLFVCSSGDSRILAQQGNSLVKYASTEGAPTGLAVDKSGTLLVADAAHCGILEVGEDGNARVVLKEFERVPFRVRSPWRTPLPTFVF